MIEDIKHDGEYTVKKYVHLHCGKMIDFVLPPKDVEYNIVPLIYINRYNS